jgi:diguanylate cyclase (GGDEF)-like protein
MQSLGDVSVGTKLSLVLGTAVCLIVAVGLFGLIQLHRVNGVAEDIRGQWLPRLELLGELKRSVDRYRLLATRQLQTTNFHQLAETSAGLDEAQRQIDAISQAYGAMIGAPEESRLFVAFQELWLDYLLSHRLLVSRLEVGEVAPAVAAFNSTSLLAFEVATTRLDELVAYAKEESARAIAYAQEIYQRAMILTIAVILAGAGCAIITVLWARRHVIRPILQVTRAMRRLAAGDWSAAVESCSRRDEIGTLVEAVAGYRDSLQRNQRLAEAAEVERARLQAAIANMPVGLSMFDADRRLIVCNHRFAEMFHLPAALTAPGTDYDLIMQGGIGPAAGQAPPAGNGLDPPAGAPRPGEPRLSLLELHDGRVLSVIRQPTADGGWVATHEDVTERRRQEARIAHLASHDPLTDLPNRLSLRRTIEQALARLPEAEEVAVLCLDLDRFKLVNDTLGHAVGDGLLAAVAARLRAALPPEASIARLGGDEFAIVQIGPDQAIATRGLAHAVIQSFGTPFEVEGHRIAVTTSVGVALAPRHGSDPDRLLRAADLALYRAKSDGRGVYRCFRAEMEARQRARRSIEADLRRALGAGELELRFQPLVNLQTDQISSFEALLRWRHPDQGMIGPTEFVPIAEETGLIVEMGEWVLLEACRAAAAWPEPVNVAVNLSAAQFHHRRLVKAVINALSRAGLLASRLELEITESAVLKESGATLAELHQLRSLGVRIAMDDFGTGYSSLSYLHRFPFDKIKIDGSFIREISDSNGSLAIVRAVAGLAASLGIATTAEGVETPAQLDQVRAEGCTEAQGYLVSLPLAAGEVGPFMAGPLPLGRPRQGNGRAIA